MKSYVVPAASSRPKLGAKQVYLMANGDLRLSANQRCWSAQEVMEREIVAAVAAAGWTAVRAHTYKEDQKHGFISSQKEGVAVFRTIDPTAPLIVAEAVWQYSHHLLHGLCTHQGPILTLANWSGTWPGLVGMLNLNGSLTKAGVKYSSLWADDFADPAFIKRLSEWLAKGRVAHPLDHVMALGDATVGAAERDLGRALADELRRDKAIMGVFDEGCMGMFNAIIPDHLLNPTGVFKERLSQSALYYETMQTSDDEARAVRQWMEDRGAKFLTGPKHDEDLTDDQILLQCKMYIAAMRIADDFGCDCVGIQYQQGLKDLLPASDLVEGTLNDSVRPPVKSRDGKRELYAGQPLPHFNEVDECAGLDGLMTYRVHRAMGQPVENTLHDLRWGDADRSGTVDDFVWVFEISGSVPPSHLIGGWSGVTSERQPAMYFPNGGGTIKGISKPGEVVWSRVFIEDGRLKMDLGRAAAIELPLSETQRRWNETTPQWPIMHAVTYGVTRDQMMARHKSNHVQVAYAQSADEADRACLAKAAMADALGLEVALCGAQGRRKVVTTIDNPRWFKDLTRMVLRCWRPGLLAAAWLFAFLPAATAPAWWDQGHRHITAGAIQHLPLPLRGFFSGRRSFVVNLSGVEPSGRHYIDIDNYPEFLAGTLPRDLNTLIALYDFETVDENGRGPWTYADYVSELTEAMAAARTISDWNNSVAPIAAELAHYIEDLHQPLHLTRNYDGQFTGNNGIHARYEGELISRQIANLTIQPSTATYLPSAIDFVFDGIEDHYDYVADIIAADNLAPQPFNASYYNSMWISTGGFTKQLFKTASEAVASSWYTAWIDAGSPRTFLEHMADFDADGGVDAADLGVWSASFGKNALADSNGDGSTDGSDFLTWQRQAGARAATAATRGVAEPATSLLLAAGLAVATLRRRVTNRERVSVSRRRKSSDASAHRGFSPPAL